MTCKLPNHPWFGKDIFTETVKHVFPTQREIYDNDTPQDQETTQPTQDSRLQE